MSSKIWQVSNFRTRSCSKVSRLTCSGLPNRAKSLEILEVVAEKARDSIISYCHWECRRPYTRNDTYFKTEESMFFNSVSHLRHMAAQEPTSLAQEIELNELRTNISTDLLQLLRNNKFPISYQAPDEYDDEIKVVSTLYAYFYLALTRIADAIPMMIWNQFVHEFSTELNDKLVRNLKLLDNVDGPEICKKYAVEEDDLQERRRNLLRRHAMLEKSARILNGRSDPS